MEIMNPTLFALCIILIVYVATCMLQWRRLTRGEEQRLDGRKSYRHKR